jgi:hypothetical protein
VLRQIPGLYQASQSLSGRQPRPTIIVQDWMGLARKLSACSGLDAYPWFKRRFQLLSTRLSMECDPAMPLGNHLVASAHIYEGMYCAEQLLRLDDEARATQEDSSSTVRPVVPESSSSSVAAFTPVALDADTRQRVQRFRRTSLAKLFRIDRERSVGTVPSRLRRLVDVQD